MPFSCSLLVASDKITSYLIPGLLWTKYHSPSSFWKLQTNDFLPYSWFITDKVPFPSSLMEAADKWLSTLFLVYYWQSTLPPLPSGSRRQNYFLPYSWFITDKVPFPSSLMEAANKVTSHLFWLNSKVLFVYTNWFFPYFWCTTDKE